jgi:hypothetical protein
MAVDPKAQQDLVVAHMSTLFPGKVFEDDQTELSYVNGAPAEYITVDFGSPVPTGSDRGITGEETQPYVIRTTFGYVAASRTAARAGASQISAGMIGFVPGPGNGPMRFIGGGTYTLTEDTVKPTLYVSEVYMSFVANL